MFVFVEDSDSSGFYIINNLDRGVLAKFIGEEVRLKGVMKDVRNRKVIEVDRLESRMGNQWGAKWTELDRIHHADH